MAVENALCMNGGDGESSYANNSLLQKKVILESRSFLVDTIKDMLNVRIPTCFKVADLGCSSGPNTLLVISEIIDTIHEMCQQTNTESPEFLVLLNDLPENDFNAIFKTLPAFHERLKKDKGDKGDKLGPCFISGTPGSFYGRLFPSQCLHLVHSSYSLHWLSQVPRGVVNNKGNIYIAKSSPHNVFKAYMDQFYTDFSMFLCSRSKEILPGGRMILTFIGRSNVDPNTNCCYDLWELLAKTLLDMVPEGFVKEKDVDSFNLPYYEPCMEEVKAIIEDEGSFNVDRLQMLEFNDPNGDIDNKYQSAQSMANGLRAVTEAMLASHFGETIIDNLFAKFAKHMAEEFCQEMTRYISIVTCMTKK